MVKSPWYLVIDLLPLYFHFPRHLHKYFTIELSLHSCDSRSGKIKNRQRRKWEKDRKVERMLSYRKKPVILRRLRHFTSICLLSWTIFVTWRKYSILVAKLHFWYSQRKHIFSCVAKHWPWIFATVANTHLW